MSIPQPISYPTSRKPWGGPGPASEAPNIPLDRYSRDDIAVVSAATGTCLSSLPPRARVQPSGVVSLAGVPGGKAPSAGATAPDAGWASGSAPAEGTVVDTTRHTVITAARRTTAEIGFTGYTLCTLRFAHGFAG